MPSYTDTMRHIHQFSVVLYESEKRLHLHDFQFNTISFQSTI